jgi:hypothetical protein
MKILTRQSLFAFLILFSGCISHQVSFHEIEYSIEAPSHDAKLTVVIDNQTLNNEVTIKSWMTGIANSWNAQPGLMVKQVADVEFPQMFEVYEFLEVFPESKKGNSHITLELTVPRYEFANFRATFTLRAKAYDKDKKVLFDNSYTQTGFTQGAKMFWAGAFGMKSSIRQSSFDALKKIFVSLRQDLTKELLSSNGN